MGVHVIPSAPDGTEQNGLNRITSPIHDPPPLPIVVAEDLEKRSRAGSHTSIMSHIDHVEIHHHHDSAHLDGVVAKPADMASARDVADLTRQLKALRGAVGILTLGLVVALVLIVVLFVTANFDSSTSSNSAGSTGSASSVSLEAASVTTTSLAANAVTSTKLGDGAVTRAKLSDSAVSSSKLATQAVDSTHIKPLAVTSSKIAGGDC